MGKLRHPLLTGIVALLLLSFAGIRWLPVAMDATASLGPDNPAAGSAQLAADQLASRQLRLRQIEAMVVESIRQYHDVHGAYPDELEQLVHTGLMPRGIWLTVARLNWQYSRTDSGVAYQIRI